MEPNLSERGTNPTTWNKIQRNGMGRNCTNFRSSEIYDGVGELYVRTIMAYVSRLEGLDEACFENLERCGEVMIKYPGMCRFITW